ncbi:hypothetical protein PSPO01_09272 [Paraphaeosphaeria sporulosa]
MARTTALENGAEPVVELILIALLTVTENMNVATTPPYAPKYVRIRAKNALQCCMRRTDPRTSLALSPKTLKTSGPQRPAI